MFRWGKEEAEAAARVIESGSLFRINSQFQEVANFEKELKAFMGADHALATTSGTTSIITALVALGIGPGDEVIVPAYTFIATASAVLAVGAIPVICEIDATLTMDPDDVERKVSKNTKAIIPVHIQGLPCDMDRLTALSKKYGFAIVEDACQADGGSYKGRRLGSIGDLGTYSFNWFKIISAGEGGALVTSNLKYYERAIIYHDTGSNFWPYEQKITEPSFNGVNFRISEITGAVLRVQLTRLDGILADLRKNALAIRDGCAGIPGVGFAPNNDLAGTCCQSLVFQFGTVEEAIKFETAIGGTRPINTGKHVFSNWPMVMTKRGGHSDASNPYLWEANRGLNADFNADSCPQSVDALSRSVHMGIDPNWDEAAVAAKIALVKGAL